MRNTRPPLPSAGYTRKKTKPFATHRKSMRVCKKLRCYMKRYSHALTDYYTQKNLQRIQSKRRAAN